MIGNPELENNWKEELVVVSGRWYSNDTLLDEVPRASFKVARGWKKPPHQEFELVLIQEMIFISNLPHALEGVIVPDSLGQMPIFGKIFPLDPRIRRT